MTMLWTNNASTTIAGSIAATDTTVNLAPGTGILFPQPLAVDDFFKATFYDQQTKTINEIVHVTGRAGDVCTIVRGQEDTTPIAWSAADIFANLITADTLRRFVQTTGPAADTSIVYVGIDTSTDIHKIVANTVPVPASYQIGMLFDIKLLNAKLPPVITPGAPPVLGSIMVELNGQTGVAMKRTDGSDFIGGETVGGEEYIFIYNGVHFTTTIMHVKPYPPQNIFYVNGTYGNDYNSGLSDNGTPSTEAFKSVQGAINRIKERYISSVEITVRVADGTYDTGWSDSGNYIASWNIVGNTSNPGNCTIDATSMSSAHYATNGSPQGSSVGCGFACKMTVQGFNFKSQYPNVGSSGNLTCLNCHFTAPLYRASDPHCVVSNGIITLGGYCTFDGQGSACGGFLEAGSSGTIGLSSYTDPIYGGSAQCQINVVGTPSFASAAGGYGAFCTAGTNGIIYLGLPGTIFSGGICHGYQYIVHAGGGVVAQGNIGVLPADMGGYNADGTGWVS